MAEWEKVRLIFIIFWTTLVFLGTGAAGGYGVWYLVSNRGNSSTPQQNDVEPSSSTQETGTTLRQGGEPVRQTIAQADFEKLSQQLWELDVSRFNEEELQLNLQTRTNTSMSVDLSPNSLFTSLDVDIRSRSPIHRQFIGLLDLYNPQTRVAEFLTPEEWNQVHEFVDTLLNTTMMTKIHSFLVERGYSSPDQDIWRSQVMSLWFWLYSRSPKYNQTDSSGFEHVFAGERRGMKVMGFHSWIQTYLQERLGLLDYRGYIDYLEQSRILNIQIQWRGGVKKQASMFLGTSPEFDMAVYTLCGLTKINRPCPMKINNQQFEVRTWDVQHKEGIQLGSAYPAV